MEVTIRLFAGLRDRAGADTVTVQLPHDARVSDALAQLSGLTDGLSVVMAINRQYADATCPLHADDELALIPPVSGGAARLHVRITDEPLALDPLLALVRDPRAGAVVSFTGVTRDVAALEYEAYTEMAAEAVEQIAAAAAERHGLCAVAVEHKVGTVPLSEPSVAIAVSAPHRAEAFAGAREIIDQLKERAPIWKREEGEWVDGHTPAAG